jgi:hypothetical protein
MTVSDGDWNELLPTLEGGWDTDAGMRHEMDEMERCTLLFRTSTDPVWQESRGAVATQSLDPSMLWCYGDSDYGANSFEVYLVEPDKDVLVEVEFEGSFRRHRLLGVSVSAPEDPGDHDLLRMAHFLRGREGGPAWNP